jgi:hypothetical protein
LKNTFYLLFISLFVTSLNAQKDSSYYGARKYFAALQISDLAKTRSAADSFSYGSTQFQIDFGMVLRQSKILRPYGQLGLGFYSQKVGHFFYDSLLDVYDYSKISGFLVQPEFGFEISPEESWYFRLGIKAPITLSSKVHNGDLIRIFHLYENGELKFQPVDFRTNIEVGKDLLHQRIDANISLFYGLKPLITIPTADKANVFGIQAGIRYHLGKLLL